MWSFVQHWIVNDFYTQVWPNLAASLIVFGYMEIQNMVRHSKLLAKLENLEHATNDNAGNTTDNPNG